LFNAYHDKVTFILPGEEAVNWQLILDTSLPEGFPAEEQKQPSGAEISTEGRSFMLFKQSQGSDEEVKATL
jgi:pullulanase/glycogen debranching enzyme